MTVLVTPNAANASPSWQAAEPELLTEGLEGAFGSTVGPDGALYVTETVAGRISRVDPETGDRTTVASCLPERIAPVGGATDVAFLDGEMYALVTRVGEEEGGSDVVGIYRVDGPDNCTVVADIGTWSVENPPDADIVLLQGVQFAFQPYQGGFLVTDGHHKRVLFATPDGAVSEVIQLPNVVPTGLAVRGCTVYLAEAGPVPHLPEDGRVVSFVGTSPSGTEMVASGAPLLVDVEPGPWHELFALSQGDFPEGGVPGAPAIPGTGALERVKDAGGFDVVASGPDRPNSLEIIGTTAYVVTLGGEIRSIHLAG